MLLVYVYDWLYCVASIFSLVHRYSSVIRIPWLFLLRRPITEFQLYFLFWARSANTIDCSDGNKLTIDHCHFDDGGRKIYDVVFKYWCVALFTWNQLPNAKLLSTLFWSFYDHRSSNAWILIQRIKSLKPIEILLPPIVSLRLLPTRCREKIRDYTLMWR